MEETEESYEPSQGLEAPKSGALSHIEKPGATAVSEDEFFLQYDLTPLDTSREDKRVPTTPSHSIDPWEVMSPANLDMEENEIFLRRFVLRCSTAPTASDRLLFFQFLQID